MSEFIKQKNAKLAIINSYLKKTIIEKTLQINKKKITCLKTEEFFTRLNMSLKFTFHWLYYFDAIFIKNIKHVPNSQTLGTKTH